MEEARGRRTLSWETVALSVIWLAVLLAFLAVLGLHFYLSNLLCWSGPDYAPDGTTYLSLWPPGPGCSFSSGDRPPSLLWSAVALLLIASGAWLMQQIRRST